MIRLRLIAAMVALGGCAHSPANRPEGLEMEPLLGFADPARCDPAPAHAGMLAGMITGNADVGFRAGRIVVPARYARLFGPVYRQPHDNYTVIGASVRGSLFGLPLAAIEQSLPEGGDPGETHWRFNASPEMVERVLAARRFPVELGRAVPIGPPEGYEHFIELIADPLHPGHTLLTCGYR